MTIVYPNLNQCMFQTSIASQDNCWNDLGYCILIDATTLIDYPNLCVLLFGVVQCNDVLLLSSNSINESSLGCADVIEHK